MRRTRRAGAAGSGTRANEPNNLLDFMLQIGPRTKNLLLGTATPIQTEVHELWDLLRILNAGADFVLGRELFGRWPDWQRALPVVKGEEIPVDERDAWEWLRNPLPPASEDSLFATLRLQLGLPDQAFFTDRGFGSLGFLEQQALGQALAPGFLREHNPVVRHTVLRRRQTLGGRRPAGESRRRCPSRPRTLCWRVRRGRVQWPGTADEPSVRSRLSGGGSIHGRAEEANEGGRLHEDAASAANLFQLCVRSIDGREDAAARTCLKTRSKRSSLQTP